MRWVAFLCFVLLAAPLPAAEFGHAGGPPIENAGEMVRTLQNDPYDLELLLSFGTSKFGSGGHLALAVRNAPDDERVYSANFYADRTPQHEKDHFTRDLMGVIPKTEYLFGTSSTVSEKCSFGLDFGEVFKRSVIGIRVQGVPPAEKAAVVAFFHRINADYANDLPSTEYHERRILYGYMDFNCAKTIGAAFRFGAGYQDLKLKGTSVISRVNPFKPLKANLPMELTMKLMALWAKRGYRMDSVLYRKYADSTYVDPHDKLQAMFRDMPNRFPSVLSLDYAEEATSYEDYDNLYAMNLLVNVGRHTVELDPADRRLKLVASQQPPAFAEAAQAAGQAASRDSKIFLRRVFHAWGIRLGNQNDNSKLYRFEPGQEPHDVFEP